MDSKRKSGAGVGDDLDDRAAKRRKLPADASDLSNGETPESTTHYGLKLLEIVKRTEDKSGRLIATEFLTLPSKRLLPDYYEVTRMPIALDTVEGKLKRREFPTLATLESYLKRMVQNAKEYNTKGSPIYDDSERVRKAVSNFMVKTNPAYKVRGYAAVPTPFPQDADTEELDEDVDPKSELEEDQPVSKKKSRPTTVILQTRSSVAPALSDHHYTNKGYEGLNLQQAQEKILEDLLTEKELPDDDFSAFADFVELPPRALKDYYRQVKNPISLLSLQRRVKGTNRKNDAVSVSEFKSWAAFEDEASNLWKNAYFYNEDGSEIFIRAQKLQKSFQKYLKEAKQAVPDSVGPKIKLKLSEAQAPAPGPKLTLKFAAKASPASTPTPQTNGSSNHNATQNGTSRRNPFGGSQPSSTPAPTLDQVDRAKSVSVSAASPSPSIVAPMKKEDTTRNSPALVAPNGTRSGSQASSTPVLSGSVMAPPLTPGIVTSDIHSSTANSQAFPQQPIQQSIPLFDSHLRQPGQAPMITNLGLATHPGLNISRHFRMDVPPSPTTTHQSITINLPSTHYYLQVKPALAPFTLDRQHRMFITCGSRLNALPLIPGHPIDPRNSLYEARLHPGVNRIEIELIAALPKGSKLVNGQDYELEKITVFANLMKS